jgi:hypothetical protein
MASPYFSGRIEVEFSLVVTMGKEERAPWISPMRTWYACDLTCVYYQTLTNLISLSFYYCTIQDMGERGLDIVRRNGDAVEESPADKVDDVVVDGKVHPHCHRVPV